MTPRSRKNTSEIFVVFVLLFAFALSLLFIPYLRVSENMAVLNALSLDEWAYLDFMNKSVYPHLANLNARVLFMRDNWGYGSSFYLVYGLFSLPAYVLGSTTTKIITLRTISIFFLAISLFFIYAIVRLRKGVFPALLAASSLMLFPAFYFFTKPFSAEFIMLAFLTASVYFYIKDNGQLRRDFFIGSALFGFALGAKISVLPSFFAIALYYSLFWRKKPLKQVLKPVLGALLLLVFAFLLSNLFLLRPGGLTHFVAELRQNLESNRTAHGYNASRVNFSTWYTDAILPHYMPVLFLGFVLLAFFLGAYLEFKNKNLRKISTLSFFLFVVNLLYIILTVKKISYWYLFPAFAFVPISVFSLPLKNRFSYLVVALAFPILLLSTNLKYFDVKYRAWFAKETSVPFLKNKRSGERIQDFISTLQPQPDSILRTAYLYFDSERFPETSVHTEWGYLNEKMLSSAKPDLILYQKNYGVFTPDEIAREWTSYEKLLRGRALYTALVNSGVEIDGEMYRYTLTLETEDAFVLKRI